MEGPASRSPSPSCRAAARRPERERCSLHVAERSADSADPVVHVLTAKRIDAGEDESKERNEEDDTASDSVKDEEADGAERRNSGEGWPGPMASGAHHKAPSLLDSNRRIRRRGQQARSRVSSAQQHCWISSGAAIRGPSARIHRDYLTERQVRPCPAVRHLTCAGRNTPGRYPDARSCLRPAHRALSESG